MVRWFRLTKNQYFGFFAMGLALFALQELPYLVMPFIPLKSNVLMEMQDMSPVLNMMEKILGFSVSSSCCSLCAGTRPGFP